MCSSESIFPLLLVLVLPLPQAAMIGCPQALNSGSVGPWR